MQNNINESYLNRNHLTTALASYVPRILQFLMAPIAFIVITKRFSPETLGAFQLIEKACFLSIFFFTLSLNKYLGYTIPSAEQKERYKIFVSVLFAEVLLYIFFVVILLFPLSGWLAQKTHFPFSSHWFWLAPALWLIYLFEHRVLLFLGMKKRMKLKVFIGVFEEGIYSCGLILLYFIGTTLLRVIAAQLTSYIMTLLLALTFLNWKILTKSHPSLRVFQAAFHYSFPLILVDASMKIIQAFDNFLIAHYYSTAAVGFYSYAFNYFNTAYLLGSPLLWSLYPFFADAYLKKTAERDTLFRFQLTWTLTLSGFASIGLLAHRFFLVPLLSRAEYLKGGNAFVLFSFYPIIISIMYLYQQVLLLEKDTKYIGINFLCAALLNIFMNFILIPRFGFQGAAFASTLCFSLLMISFIHRCKIKKYDIRVSWIIRFVIGLSIWAGFLYLLRIPGQHVPMLYLILTMVAAIPIAVLMKLIDIKELWHIIFVSK